MWSNSFIVHLSGKTWGSVYIALAKRGIHRIIFLFFHEIRGYSLEASQQGISNEYPQYMFSWRNKKNISTFWLKNVPRGMTHI